MKKIYQFIVLLLVFVSVSSCDKWLDVKPENRIYPEEKFVNSQGFQSALAGVYNYMSKPILYGKEMEFGTMDVLAGYWNLGTYTSHEYYRIGQYEYDDVFAKPKLDSLWMGLYSAIRQTNIILENVDNIATDADYDLIKGEALGLRAFLHLEAFRLFGPIVKTDGLNTLSVPYYGSLSKVPNKSLTSLECLNQVEADLQAALLLLQDDPIKTAGRLGNSNSSAILANYNQLLDRRGVRMNYYAVKALLARKSLWEGKMDVAGGRAAALIAELQASNAVRFITRTEIETNSNATDYRFSVENIFALYANKHNLITRNYFEVGYHNEYQILRPQYAQLLAALYTTGTGSANDYRLNKWNINTDYFNKFIIFSEQASVSIDFGKHYEIQLINLPELYFIVAESKLETNPAAAVESINAVRAVRNIDPLLVSTNSETVFGYLLDEIRREYIAEGVLFSYYKRWNHSVYVPGGEIPASSKIFVLPKPTAELLLNPSN